MLVFYNNNKNLFGKIDNLKINFNFGLTIMDVCQNIFIDLPKFCYHEKLSIAGNCRICLVETNVSKKLVVSCATYMSNDLEVWTNSLRVKKARFSVIEFLLVNHPLDCPICDQGGECDLQDITLIFGSDKGRFYESKKKAFFDKNFDPFIKTSMNRCIHCTKCIRFISEIGNFYTLGFVNRGSNLEISTYINTFLYDELSGNLIDLCPVGALTSKLYFFEYRSWELSSKNFIDIFDALHSKIKLEFFFNKVKRILPYLNEEINEDWISNKIRFSFDGFYKNRVISCFKKVKFNFISIENITILFESFIKISWKTTFQLLSFLFLNQKIKNVFVNIGNLIDLETVIILKKFFNKIGLNSFYIENFLTFNIDFTFLYLFNLKIKNFYKYPTICLVIGSNLRLESPILNFKFKRMITYFNNKIYSIGLANNFSTYKIINISNSLNSLLKIFKFKHYFCQNFFKKNSFNQFPFFVFGNFFFNYSLNFFFLKNTIIFIQTLFKNFNFFTIFLNNKLNIEIFQYFGIIYNYSNKLNLFKIGCVFNFLNYYNFYFLKTFLKNKKVFYLFNSNDLIFLKKLENIFVIYQNSYLNYDDTLFFYDLIIPNLNFLEKSFSISNLEDLIQFVNLDYNKKTTNIKKSYFFKAFWEYIFQILKKYNLFYYENNLFLFFKIETKFFDDIIELRFFFSYFFQQNNFFFNNFILNEINLLKYFFYFSIKMKKYLIFLINLSYFNILFKNYFIYSFFQKKINLIYLNPTIINYYYDKSNLILIFSFAMNYCANFFFKKNFSFSNFIL